LLTCTGSLFGEICPIIRALLDYFFFFGELPFALDELFELAPPRLPDAFLPALDAALACAFALGADF
jgi:hypothetical protein